MTSHLLLKGNRSSKKIKIYTSKYKDDVSFPSMVCPLKTLSLFYKWTSYEGWSEQLINCTSSFALIILL